jgi:predicted double-glycine peptidase
MNNFRLLTRTRQSTEYSCGASALQAVLSYWGMPVDESDLMDLMGTNAEVGTYPEHMVRAARFLGFDAEMKENLTVDEVRRYTQAGDPMIALAQVWRSYKEGVKSAADEWESGHYIVVLGVDDDYVYFQDPYVRMSKAFVPRKSFEDHWHQIMGGAATGNPKLMRVGVLVKGRRRARKRGSVKRKATRPDFRKLGSLNLIVTRFRGLLLPYDLMTELQPIWESGDVRPDAFLLLRKDKKGNLSGMQGGRLHDEGDMGAINAVLSALASRSAKKSAASRRTRVERAVDAVAQGDFGLSAGEIRKLAERLPPSHSAVAVIVENVWERKFKEAAKRYAGTVIDQRLMTPDAVASAARKLAAGR